MTPPWPFVTWRELVIAVGVTVVVILGAGIAASRYFRPGPMASDGGLGPGWQCSNPGRGGPICVRQGAGP